MPRPVAHSRHALAMERACGIELSRANIQNPEEAMEAVLEEVAKAYSLKVIHADLSEFNIFVSEGGVEIIDWPRPYPRIIPMPQSLWRGMWLMF